MRAMEETNNITAGDGVRSLLLTFVRGGFWDNIEMADKKALSGKERYLAGIRAMSPMERFGLAIELSETLIAFNRAKSWTTPPT